MQRGLCGRLQIIEREITVGHRIEAVGGGHGKAQRPGSSIAVDRKTGAGQRGSTQGAFGRPGGPSRRGRKSKRARRQEYEQMQAPTIGGVRVRKGNGETVRLPRGASLTDFAELAMRAREEPVATVSLVPPQVDTANPDIDKVHAMVERAIAHITPAEIAAYGFVPVLPARRTVDVLARVRRHERPRHALRHGQAQALPERCDHHLRHERRRTLRGAA